MLGLIIRDQIRWHDRWSAEIGRQLTVRDSTNDMYIFEDSVSRDDILSILSETPQDVFQLIELEEAPEENCDFLLDSGKCYSRIQ